MLKFDPVVKVIMDFWLTAIKFAFEKKLFIRSYKVYSWQVTVPSGEKEKL